MQKPVLEDFGLTSQEYTSLVAERNQLQKAIVTQPSSIFETLILGIIGSLYTGMFVGIVGIIVAGGIGYVLGKVFGAQLGDFVSIALIKVVIVVAIVWASGCFILILTEPYSERRKLKQYREKLSGPQYNKVALYEEAIREYKYHQEEYWKLLKGVEFERELSRLYTDMGYSVRLTKGSGDEGIDLILRKDNKEIIVQCKGHEKPIGVQAIRDLYGVMMHKGAECAVLACPVGFTDGVKTFAYGKPIKLLTAKELVEMAESIHNEKKHE
jgi:HJR/Mrr/RecB family endonuclease